MQLFDKAAPDRFTHMEPSRYRGARGALLVFALDDAVTLPGVEPWRADMARFCEEPPMILVGTRLLLSLFEPNKSQGWL